MITEGIYTLALSVFNLCCPYLLMSAKSFPLHDLTHPHSTGHVYYPFVGLSCVAGIALWPCIVTARARTRKYLLFSIFVNLAILINFTSHSFLVFYKMFGRRHFLVMSHCLVEILFRGVLATAHLYLICNALIYYEILYYELDAENSELYLTLLHHLGPHVDDEIGFGMNMRANFEILLRRQRRALLLRRRR